MDAVAAAKPCCVCDEPGGKHCTKCKSRFYCSKKCQVIDWKEGGHKARCGQLVALQDGVVPKNEATQARKIKEAPSGDWRGDCAICYHVLPLEADRQFFHECCCQSLCRTCSLKCKEYNTRCPLCRAHQSTTPAERLDRLQKHVAKGNAEAQLHLGHSYHGGFKGCQKSPERAVQNYALSAAQGNAVAQVVLGYSYEHGEGIKQDYAAAAMWYLRAANQGHPTAQSNLGDLFHAGKGVAQSYDAAVKYWRLAAEHGHPDTLFNLGVSYLKGHGAARDVCEALRFFDRAAAQGHDTAASISQKIRLAMSRPN